VQLQAQFAAQSVDPLGVDAPPFPTQQQMDATIAVLLHDLTDQHLKDLGVTSLGHRLKMLGAIG
jgi:SAM domain (Sterile alpha motif)